MAVSGDERSIANTYYESLRDNYERQNWENDPRNPQTGPINVHRAEQLKAVWEKFQELDPLTGASPTLGQVFNIELNLATLAPEAELRARYWSVENRFNRVMPAEVSRAFHARHKVDDVDTYPEGKLRELTRILLDSVHANYQVNFRREVYIRRLMIVVSIISAVLLVICGFTVKEVVPRAGQHALALIAVVGMAGAIISTIQRLQKATSRDAMVDDGIFELISLRVGGLSILMSIGIGGISALFIFALISAGLLESIVPQLTDGAGEASPATAAIDPKLLPGVAIPCGQGQLCPHWADITYQALGLQSRADLFKLTVYGFVAGFAERFVPDTINKLAKQVIPDAKLSAS
jgi:hypothetical protein